MLDFFLNKTTILKGFCWPEVCGLGEKRFHTYTLEEVCKAYANQTNVIKTKNGERVNLDAILDVAATVCKWLPDSQRKALELNKPFAPMLYELKFVLNKLSAADRKLLLEREILDQSARCSTAMPHHR